MRLLVLTLICATALSGLACARQPSDKRISSLTRSYFNRYGRKYKTTEFGLSKTTKVDVESTNELHKGLVESVVTLHHADSSTSHVRCSVMRNDPFGWKVTSWENLK